MKELKQFIIEKIDILDDGLSAKVIFSTDDTMKIAEFYDALNTVKISLEDSNDGEYKDLVVKAIANGKPSFFKFDNNNQGVFEFKYMGSSQYINKNGIQHILDELDNEQKKSNSTIQIFLENGVNGKLICDIRSNTTSDFIDITFYKQTENYKLDTFSYSN